MTPIELLASNWIWFAIFGVVAVPFFLRARRRTLPSFAEPSPGASEEARDPDHGPEAAPSGHPLRTRSGDGGTASAGGGPTSRATGHDGHGGHRRHGCC